MPVLMIATNTVPAVLQSDFSVEAVTEYFGVNALQCVSDIAPQKFYLYRDGGECEGEAEPSLSLYITFYRPSAFDATELIEETQPVYPFKASEMPDTVKGLINMAEQWLINLDGFN